MLLRLTQLNRECKLHRIQSVYETISPDSTAPKFEAEIILLEANMWVGTRGEYWRGNCDDRWRNGKSKPEPFSTECQGRRPEADDIIYTFCLCFFVFSIKQYIEAQPGPGNFCCWYQMIYLDWTFQLHALWITLLEENVMTVIQLDKTTQVLCKSQI